MVTARSYELRFDTGVVSVDGTYGADGRTYGEPGWTYGQQGTDPTLTSYTATAFPGWGPRTPDWEYRQWDTSPDMEIALLGDDAVAVDYATIASAELVMTLIGYGAYSYQPSFPLTVGVDRLTRTWELNDLLVPGNYRVAVVVTFDSGRTMTCPTNDTVSMIVRGAPKP